MRCKLVLAIIDHDLGLQGLMNRFRSFEDTGHVDCHVNSFSRLGTAKARYHETMGEVAVSEELGLSLPRDHPRFWRAPSWEEEAQAKRRGEDQGTLANGKRWRLFGGLPRIWELPEGWRLKSAPVAETMSFQEFVETEWALPYKEEGEKADLFGPHKWGWLAHEEGELVDVVVRTNPRGKWASWRPGGIYGASLVRKPTGACLSNLMVKELDLRTMRKRQRERRMEKLQSLLDECQGFGYSPGEALDQWRRYVETGGADKLEEKYEEAGGPLNLGEDRLTWLAKQSDPELAAIKEAVGSKVAITLACAVPEGVDDPVLWAKESPGIGCQAIVMGQDWWEDDNPMRWQRRVTSLLEDADPDQQLWALEVRMK